MSAALTSMNGTVSQSSTTAGASGAARVLVERVEGFASQEQWERADNEIVEFERTLAAEGMMLITFWMHVAEEEQLDCFWRRAKIRRSSPRRTGASAPARAGPH